MIPCITVSVVKQHPSASLLNQASQTISGAIDPSLRRVRHLLVLDENDDQRAIELQAASYFVGRDPTNAIVLASKDISRQHAIFLRITGSNPNDYHFLLIDGNLQGKASANGTRVNGERCLSNRLCHGDKIHFGCQVTARYLILEPLTDADFEEYCARQEYEEFLTRSLDYKGTIVMEPSPKPQFDAASLVRLASFPEILPCPMFEVNLRGELTYLNPAAINIFPDLPMLGLEHPTLDGLMLSIKESSHKILSREVRVADLVFEQTIHFIAENGLIRSCLFDITQRKYAEAELLKRDRLLQSVAEANSHLLANIGFEEAINNAIATFGSAAGVDRIRIFQQQSHVPNNAAAGTMLRYEWSAANAELLDPATTTTGALSEPLHQTQHLPRWYGILRQGKILREQVRSQPEAERYQWEQAGILSLLVIPIIVSDDFWGFMEIGFCRTDFDWSTKEESIVLTLVTSISGALQRQNTDELIKHQAYYDALTGLPNRILFTDRLDVALSEARRTQQSLAVMFMDLDRFKKINDTLGHAAGDLLLQEVASRIKQCLRDSDTVARWGGDEFTVLLPHINHVEDATATAQRILDAFQTVVHLDGHDIYANTSIGIAFYPADGKDADTLLKNADSALYQSKERGRGIYQLFNLAINNKVSLQFELRLHLRDALKRDEFKLYYQPQIDLNTGLMTGVEALLRWQHPEQGLITPATFLPLAEETGLMLDIGAWVLRTACQQANLWHQAGLSTLKLAINLSARQFFDPSLINIITDALAATTFPHQYLVLEITEATAIKNMEFTQRLLRELQQMGLKIGMDDFGTGYSSLNYLAQLPLDILKIDQCFIQNLQANTKEFQITNALIALGNGLGLEVVAEGVDSQDQLDLLKMLHCPVVQGYCTCPPMNAEQVTGILQANWRQQLAPSTTPAHQAIYIPA